MLTAHVYRPGWEKLGGGLGVTIFFVLSGFLITRLLLGEKASSGHVDLRSFYIRRAFRLFPIYYLVLAIYCLLLLGLRMRPDFLGGFKGALAYYAFYLQEIPFFRSHSEQTPFYQSWSLGIEEKFYFVWPFVAFCNGFVGTLRARKTLATTCVVVFSAAQYFASGRYIFPYAAISMGCLLALLDNDPTFRMRLNSGLSSWRSWAAVALLCLFHVIAVSHVRVASSVATLLYPIGVSLVLIASLSSRSLGAALSSGPMTLLGRLSYGIYLIHLLVRNAVEVFLRWANVARPSGFTIYLLMLLFSTLFAGILNVLVETPLRRMGRNLASKTRPRRLRPEPLVDSHET